MRASDKIEENGERNAALNRGYRAVSPGGLD